MSERERLAREIERRVRQTICPTYNSLGTRTIEGRISQEDFDTLLMLALSAAPVYANEETAP